MHEERDRAQDSIGVIDEPDQLSDVGFSAKINYPLKFGMKVASSADLDELYSTAKVVDDFLIATSVPPFDRIIAFSTGRHHPVGSVLSDKFCHWRTPELLCARQMDVSFELGGPNLEVQALV